MTEQGPEPGVKDIYSVDEIAKKTNEVQATGVDTSGMSEEELIDAYNKLQANEQEKK